MSLIPTLSNPDFKPLLQSDAVFGLLTQAVEKEEVEAYLIGGFVRDALLNRPCKDLDIVCVGSGIKLAERFASMLPGNPHVTVFKTYGTAMLHAGDWEVEFVGARKESYAADSRKPAVETGTLQDDQNRRDFTINALGVSLNEKTLGKLIDPFDGLGDLKRKLIRTPLAPAETFSDDPLRIMRGLRFAAQLSFDIEPDTYEAMTEMRERLNIVSAERISDELNKIIVSKVPSYGFKLLYFSKVLEVIFPEMVALAGAENKEGHTHKDNFFHTLEVLENVAQKSDDLWLRWAAILHDIAKPATKRYVQGEGWTFHGHEDKGAKMVPRIFARFKLPLNEKMRFVQSLVKLHLRPIALVKNTVTDSAVRRIIFEAGNSLEALMILCRADVTTKNPNKAKRFLENFDNVDKKIKEVEESDRLRNFQPVLTGEHIMAAFGITPGREIGIIKEQIREAILEGEIKNNFSENYTLMVKLGKDLDMAVKLDEASLTAQFPPAEELPVPTEGKEA